jgi:hypothetical protein
MRFHIWKRFLPHSIAEIQPVNPISYTVEVIDDVEVSTPVYPEPESPYELIGNGTLEEIETWKAEQISLGNWTPQSSVAVPAVVTCATLRIAIKRNHSITEEMVDAVIAGIPDADAKWEAETLWKKSPTIRRAHPLVAAIASVFGLTSTQVDAAFVLADTL